MQRCSTLSLIWAQDVGFKGSPPQWISRERMRYARAGAVAKTDEQGMPVKSAGVCKDSGWLSQQKVTWKILSTRTWMMMPPWWKMVWAQVRARLILQCQTSQVVTRSNKVSPDGCVITKGDIEDDPAQMRRVKAAEDMTGQKNDSAGGETL